MTATATAATPTCTSPTSPTPARTIAPRGFAVVRRLAALVVVVATMLGIVALSPAPASAAAPTAPKIIYTAGYQPYIKVWFAMPASDGGEQITNYRIERWKQGKAEADEVWNQATTTALYDTTALEDVMYQYRVRAENEDGASPWSNVMAGKRNPWSNPLHKHKSDPATFVQRQYQDLLGRQPGFGERNTAVLALKNGTATPASIVTGLVHRAERVELRHPVIRLYLAYFDRAPDHIGLQFWLNKRAKGTKLDAVSNHFAASSEFQTKYGALSNADFVTLVYQNVLDRDPDAAGHAYWTKKLDEEAASRGRVMTLFSESNEYRTKSKPTVLVADVHDDLLASAMPALQAGPWIGHVAGGAPIGEFATYLFVDVDYIGS